MFAVLMKVNLIKRQTIEAYALQNARSRSSFRLWLNLLKQTNWEEPSDIMDTFGAADLLGNGSNRVVFNIAGNNYRMICKYHFGVAKVHLYIKWIGTHAEYSKLCDNNEQYTIDIY
jgi:mRNA interferase HigB